MELITSHINLLSNYMKDEHVIQLQNILKSFGPLDTLFTKEYNTLDARIKIIKILGIIGNINHELNKLLAIEILMFFIKCNKHVYANNIAVSNVFHKQYTDILIHVKEKLESENEEYIRKFYFETISPFEEIIGLVHDINVCM